MLNYQSLKKYLFKLDPESAHKMAELGLRAAKHWPVSSIIKRKNLIVSDRLNQNIFGRDFPNPVGLAAGFDKNGTMIEGMTALGFGFIEIGTVTPKPQSGNKKPRLFRFPEQENAIEDYVSLISRFKNVCDYVVINVSSPNTPGLRDLQNEVFIKTLLNAAKEITQKPTLLKISPDMETSITVDLCTTAVENGAAGIIATNTSVDYTLLPNTKRIGGISGKAIQDKSFHVFDAIAKKLYGKTLLISVGGIDSGAEAYRRIKAGASLVQVYTALIFHGPSVVRKINEEILKLLDKDGYHHISEAIGKNRR